MAPIAIIGGGPSGLTFARLLECYKIDYVVYERSPSAILHPSQQGGSLDLHLGTGQLALKQAGLTPEFERLARRGGQVVMLDQDGNQLLTLSEGRDKPEIDRAQLRLLLAQSIPPRKIQWNKTVTSVKRDEAGIGTVSFTDGTSEAGFNLVVGADGAWSQIRQLITSTRPEYSGKHYLESKVSKINPYYQTLRSRVGEGALFAIGSGKHIAVQSMSDGSYLVYIGLCVPEDFFTADKGMIDLLTKDGALARDYFLSHVEYFANWATEIRDIIKNCEGPFRRWPLYHMPVEGLNWDSTPGLTLLGDAAHVSTPFVGEGVNCAMFDALELANRIAEYGTEINGLNRAVKEYEKDMLKRGKSLIERSSASAALLFAEDPVELVRVISASNNI